MSLPNADEPVGFAEQVKPLFRHDDRRAMNFAFDLWDYDDVVANRQAILQRLEDGTMPCDVAWPAERVAVFRHWVETGTPP